MNVLGNLGNDAQITKINGKDHVSFRIATSKSFLDEHGTKREVTTWVSALMYGDGGNLTQYLKKGTKVYVSGDAEIKPYRGSDGETYVSINVFVRDFELCGSKRD